MSLLDDLEQLRKEALSAFAAAQDARELEDARIKFVGAKGRVKELLGLVGKAPPEIKPQAGKLGNQIKNEIEAAFEKARSEKGAATAAAPASVFDISEPLPVESRHVLGRSHPLTRLIDSFTDIFHDLGFEVVDGPEIEDQRHNFDDLNIPPDHPARDSFDTFFLDGNNQALLRSQTSTVQVRIMETRMPPIRVVAPGRVYRPDPIDTTHHSTFHQIEGLCVDRKVSMADLRGTLKLFVGGLFGPDTPVRFRPSFFPFTEPSAELDCGCPACGGSGCPVCKQTGWVELGGCGMVDPAVFEAINHSRGDKAYDPEEWSGFAFGFGIERLAMRRHGITDIRRFLENDLRFLRATMKLPVAWLQDYLPENLRGEEFTGALAAACRRWDLKPERTDADTLGKLFTFAGFNCDGVENGALILDVLSNRPDAQCVLGLAREAAAILRVPLKRPSIPKCNSEGKPASEEISVCVEEPELCPRYTARVIRGVKVGPSPAWLVQRLQSMGLQSRNNIVDVTNFVLFEMNQPLHAFDLAGLAEKKIVVRRAKDKEPFAPLYGEVPPLTPETLVIADGEKPRAIAGILGGKGSEVTPATTDILLEAAYFNPANTRRTVRRLKVMDGKGTDSSYRFERGIDMENVERASARAAALIVEVAGGSVAPGIVDVRSVALGPRVLTVHFDEVARVFGAEIPKKDCERILTDIGCEIGTVSDTGMQVTTPSWRTTDLLREIDLIEELARLYGYNHLPDVTKLAARIAPRSGRERVSAQLRKLLTALGYFETVSDSLIDPKTPALPVWTLAPPFKLDPSSVLREDHSVLRNCLLSSLLSIRKHNQDQRTGEARLFELNTVFLPGTGPRPTEKPVLALCDDRGFQTLADALLRIDGALELDGAHLRLSRPLQTAPAFLNPAQACRILRVRETAGHERAEDVIGWMGTLSAELQKAFDLRNAPAVCEIDLLALANLPSAPGVYAPLPSFPEITRDIAIVVDEAVAWSEIENFARDWQRQEPLRDARETPRFLSTFRGKQVGFGKKSVAFSLVYRAADRTLTDDEVNPAHQKFLDALLKKFNATLRA